MEVNLNFNHREIIKIDNCVKITQMSNQKIISLFFDKEIDRKMALFSLNRANSELKIVEADNSEYPELEQCYKLYINYDVPIVLDITQ